MAYETAKYYNAALYGMSDITEGIAHLERNTAYLSEAHRQTLIDTCFYAANAHDGQKRHSGEPYVCHPIKVAEILANEVQFDLPVLQGAVLHDVIEDTPITKEKLVLAFDEEIANLVDGVSKLDKSEDVSPQEHQALTFAKLAVAMEADPRVVMIKFADRMHNMQTLGALRPEKRRRIAQETLDIYVPIANRLGMFVFKSEMENFAFKHLYPWRYRTIEKLASDTHPNREAAYADVNIHLTDNFRKINIRASIRKRRRNLFDIYKRLERTRQSRRPLEKASIPIIVIAETTDECYRALGVIHRLYTPVFKKLSDYIASVKVNGYQSIHTSVLTEDRRVLNFQIRTKYMHTVAESGIIAIWRQHNLSKSEYNHDLRRDKSMRRWLENIRDLSTIATNPVEFYEAVKCDLTEFKIQVLTPKGEPIALPKGATVIDFAYHIHTELGDHLESTEVNGVKVPVDYNLSNGQMVELFTSSSASPDSVWLKRVKTERARTAIRHCLSDLPTEKLAQLGLAEIKRYLANRKIHYRQLEFMLETVAKNRGVQLKKLLCKIAMHDVKRKSISAELQTLTHETGGVTTILHVQMRNRPGALGAVADTIGKHHANIIRIEFPSDMHESLITMLFETNIHDPSQVDSVIGDLFKQPLVKRVKREEIIHETSHLD